MKSMTLALLTAAALALVLSGQAVAEEPVEAAAEEAAPEPSEAAAKGAAQGAAPKAAAQGAAPKAAAQAAAQADGIDKLLATLTERLELTDEQQAKVRPILEEHVGTLRDAHARAKAGDLDYEKLMAETQAAGKTRNEKLATVLEPEQKKAYAKYQQENRQRRAKAARLARQQKAQKEQAAQ